MLVTCSDVRITVNGQSNFFPGITNDKKYFVKEIRNDPTFRVYGFDLGIKLGKKTFYLIEDDFGVEYYYPSFLFEEISKKRNEKILQILE